MTGLSPRSGRQATVVTPRRIEIVASEHPPPKPGFALIQVESCGVCGSDLTMYRGSHPVIRPPIVLGHEVIGTLADLNVQDHSGFSVGDRVAFLPQVGCGDCAACRGDDPRLCVEMKLVGGQIAGGMADLVAVPIANLIGVPAGVPAPLRVLAEPLAVAVHGAGRAPLGRRARCLVLGCGPIGLLMAFVLRSRSVSQVVVLDLDPWRLEIARRFGFETREALPNGEEPFDAVFECVGGAEPAQAALTAVRPGGHVVLIGVAAPNLSFNGVLLQRQERTVTGSHMYTRSEFEEAFRLLAGGLVPGDAESLALLFDRRGLEDIDDMLGALDRRAAKAIKLVVDF